MSKRVFQMVCRRRYCRKSCLKGRWSLWGSSDPKAIEVEAICLQDLGAAGSEAPRAIVECRGTGQSSGAFRARAARTIGMGSLDARRGTRPDSAQFCEAMKKRIGQIEGRSWPC